MVTEYTVLDSDSRSLILLRPYQIHAINAVRSAMKERKSGYVWHTTGERVIIVMGAINVLVSRFLGTFIKYNSWVA